LKRRDKEREGWGKRENEESGMKTVQDPLLTLNSPWGSFSALERLALFAALPVHSADPATLLRRAKLPVPCQCPWGGGGGRRLLISARQATLTRRRPRVRAPRHPLPAAFPEPLRPLAPDSSKPATSARSARDAQALDPCQQQCHRLREAPGLLCAALPSLPPSNGDLQQTPEQPQGPNSTPAAS
jgi:hypothetical protein